LAKQRAKYHAKLKQAGKVGSHRHAKHHKRISKKHRYSSSGQRQHRSSATRKKKHRSSKAKGKSKSKAKGKAKGVPHHSKLHSQSKARKPELSTEELKRRLENKLETRLRKKLRQVSRHAKASDLLAFHLTQKVANAHKLEQQLQNQKRARQELKTEVRRERAALSKDAKNNANLVHKLEKKLKFAKSQVAAAKSATSLQAATQNGLKKKHVKNARTSGSLKAGMHAEKGKTQVTKDTAGNVQHGNVQKELEEAGWKPVLSRQAKKEKSPTEFTFGEAIGGIRL
jgi:hypothetical protein